MWKYHMEPMGYPPLPPERCHDTMATAAMKALPLGLEATIHEQPKLPLQSRLLGAVGVRNPCVPLGYVVAQGFRLDVLDAKRVRMPVERVRAAMPCRQSRKIEPVNVDGAPTMRSPSPRAVPEAAIDRGIAAPARLSADPHDATRIGIESAFRSEPFERRQRRIEPSRLHAPRGCAKHENKPRPIRRSSCARSWRAAIRGSHYTCLFHSPADYFRRYAVS